MEKMPHIKLSAEDTADYAIIAGDPARIDVIARHLDQVTPLAWNREFKSIRGYFHDIPVLAVSTGIGAPSAAIAIEELSRIGVKTIIRVGSSGALQTNLKLGTVLIANQAVLDDGTSKAYVPETTILSADLLLVKACQESAEELGITYTTGLCRSHDCLYLENKRELDELWSSKGAAGSDMETAALFAVSRCRGIQAASLLNVVVEYQADLSVNINRYTNGGELTAMGEKNQILTALYAFERIEKESKNHIKKDEEE